MEVITKSVEETEAFGENLAKKYSAPHIFCLTGDLGAGKTAMTRGIARGYGFSGRVSSPTFTIMQLHDTGRLPLYHFDWYRLESAEELYELSMDEYLQNGGVAVIEWPSRAEEVLPESYLEVALEPLGDDERQITFTPVGGFRTIDEEAIRAAL